MRFAIEGGRRVSAFDPETGELRTIGGSIEDWAEWLLVEPDERGTRLFATGRLSTPGSEPHAVGACATVSGDASLLTTATLRRHGGPSLSSGERRRGGDGRV